MDWITANSIGYGFATVKCMLRNAMRAGLQTQTIEWEQY